ncbi:phosphate/phosphite/phosphonate ABC transporter substrate-binding protein [Desulfovibrio litoralis]|uniref:Phosphonate transport system substrate-binding protein n=1 Tax=Desulfovibrio litoralis DSM 11393 TaxID=1121455 RepID=A0A1M7TI45_9BACT|nr:phosphate/phosphite/phosphonate ABC transporter substrate-binding protein [Desulfovibrio litoralis]SHN70434.1 phosphonate transport system substrate-binding protein [Desulfovibrio litoralis DSM 11393]
MLKTMQPKQKKAFIVALLTVLFLILLPWLHFKETLNVDFKQHAYFNVTQPVKTLTYAVLPQYSRTITYQKYDAFVDYLRKSTHLRIKQIFPANFEEHLRMIENGEIDISFVNSVVAIYAEQKGAKIFAKAIGTMGHDKGTDIVVRRDNVLIQNIQDCAGKRWVGISPLSSNGYIFPLDYFKENNIDIKGFKKIYCPPSLGAAQETVLLNLLSGEYDFATIPNGSLETTSSHLNPNNFKVIASFPPLDSWVFIAGRNLSEDQLKRIKKAMFSLDINKPSTRKLLNKMGAEQIVPATRSDLATTQRIMEKLGILNINKLYETLWQDDEKNNEGER